MKILVSIFLFFLSISCTKEHKSNSSLYKVALIDSFFCNEKYYKKYHLQVVFPLKSSNQKTDCEDSLLSSPAYHGHRVILEIGSRLKSKKNFLFFLINVFNPDGTQDHVKWKKAVQFVNQNNIDLVVTASGYFQDDKLNKEKFEKTLLAASGNALGPLAHRPALFPQTSSSPHMYLVGSFYPEKNTLASKPNTLIFFKDPLNMNQNRISFFMPGSLSTSELSGTSLAVSLGTSFFLNHCAPDDLEACLKKKSISFLFTNEKGKLKKHKTFPLM